jgi:DNA replication protein DnaC
MKEFRGSESLLDIFNKINENYPGFYKSGSMLCLSGGHGKGKTTILTQILKKGAQKNYSVLYTTLGDVVDGLISAPYEDKFSAKKELTMVDILCIDELDPRHINNGAGADLFGRTLDRVLRTRYENKLPTLFATNSPNVKEIFTGEIKASLDSIMSKMKEIPVIGKDFRKE